MMWMIRSVNCLSHSKKNRIKEKKKHTGGKCIGFNFFFF